MSPIASRIKYYLTSLLYIFSCFFITLKSLHAQEATLRKIGLFPLYITHIISHSFNINSDANTWGGMVCNCVAYDVW